MISILQATIENIQQWLILRTKLWPPAPDADFLAEVNEILASENQRAFLAFVKQRPVGLIELSIRPYADGCSTSNVGYVEGVYVEPEFRRQEIAKSLLFEAERWFIGKGCKEMASDADIDNDISYKMHMATGFKEVGRIVQFARKIG